MIDRLMNIDDFTNLVGECFKSYRVDKMFNAERSFGKIDFLIGNKRYVLENNIECFENYFWGKDEASVFTFKDVSDEKEMKYTEDEDYLDINVSSKIDDILLIQDTVVVFEKNKQKEIWKSTEGIVIYTKERQYAFFKEDTFSELINIYKGHDTFKELESVNDHWDIFADELSSKNSREVISVKTKQLFNI